MVRESDKAKFLRNLSEWDRLTYLIDEARDIEDLYRARRIKLQQDRAQL